MTKRKLAIVSGIALLLMGIIAAYAIGYLFPMFKDQDQLTHFAMDTDSFLISWTNMLLGIGFILFLDFLVSLTLAKYFENESKQLSWGMGFIRIVYTLIFAFATLQMTRDLDMDKPSMDLVYSNILNFEFIWNIGLSLFGFHVLILGVLMRKHSIHFLLWGITIFAGFCYIILPVMKVGGVSAEVMMVLEAILFTPMAIGELGLAIWLILKGAKS